jgi:AcrR family transcriptional regulator
MAVMNERDDMKDYIIEAAREVFAKYGYRKTTIEDIANSIYKAKSTIYHYFTGKEDIFRAVVEIEANQTYSAIKEAVNAASNPIDKFKTALRTSFITMKEKTNYFRFLKEEWFVIFDFTIEARIREGKKIDDIIKNILIEGNGQGVFAIENIEEKTLAIQTSFKGFWDPWSIGSEEISIKTIDSFLDLILEGLLKR